MESIAAIKRQGLTVLDNDDDLVDDHDDLGDDFIEDEDDPHTSRLLRALKQSSPLLQAPTHRPLQPPFQPGSTLPDEKLRRFLVWNSVGQIVSVADREGESRIEIRFANQSGNNRNEVLMDRSGFVLGALANEGAVFATDVELEPNRDRCVRLDMYLMTFGFNFHCNLYLSQTVCGPRPPSAPFRQRLFHLLQGLPPAVLPPGRQRVLHRHSPPW